MKLSSKFVCNTLLVFPLSSDLPGIKVDVSTSRNIIFNMTCSAVLVLGIGLVLQGMRV